MTQEERATLVLLGGVSALVAELAKDAPRAEPQLKEREESEELAKAREEGWEEGYAYHLYHSRKQILERLGRLLERTANQL